MKIIKSYWLCASANKWSLKQWKHLNWNDCSVQASGTKSEAVEKKKHWQSFISLSIQTYHILQNTMHTRWNENSVVVFLQGKKKQACVMSAINYLHNLHSIWWTQSYLCAYPEYVCLHDVSRATCYSVFCTHVQSGQGLCGF